MIRKKFRTYTLVYVLTIDGGALELHQTVTGKIAQFNMWDYEMGMNELNMLPCVVDGNLVSWSTLLTMGTAAMTFEDFPCNSKH